MSRPTIDHRSPEFARLSLEVLEGLKRIFQTSAPAMGSVKAHGDPDIAVVPEGPYIIPRGH